jgi:hypothetical protein
LAEFPYRLEVISWTFFGDLSSLVYLYLTKPNILSSFKASSWKKFFQDNCSLDYSNKIVPQITDSANLKSTPSSIFETISKNPGIGLLCLDSDGENINMFHNPGIIGGTWFQSEQMLVSILYFHEKAIAVKIKESLIIGAN